MNIADIVTAKRQLEADLRDLIKGRFQEFVNTTGIYPESISVNMSNHSIIGLAEVECRIIEVIVGIRV